MNEVSLTSSDTESDYLVQIYLLLREGRKVVGARIAERLKVSDSAVTQALKRLKRKNLLNLEDYDGLRLTQLGRQQAERIVRRHYLLERLLVDELGYDWVDVDQEADNLEHSLSPRLEEHLLKRLGNPTTCPHGNPFPGSPEEQRLLFARRLTEAQEGENTAILRITEEAEENDSLMRLLFKFQVKPGTKINIKKITDNSLLVLNLDTGADIELVYKDAHSICVEDVGE